MTLSYTGGAHDQVTRPDKSQRGGLLLIRRARPFELASDAEEPGCGFRPTGEVEILDPTVTDVCGVGRLPQRTPLTRARLESAEDLMKRAELGKRSQSCSSFHE